MSEFTANLIDKLGSMPDEAARVASSRALGYAEGYLDAMEQVRQESKPDEAPEPAETIS